MLSVNLSDVMPHGARALCLLFCFSTMIAYTSSLSFNFSSFNQDTSSKMTFQGNAVINDNTILLTKDGANMGSVGRVVYNEQLLLWDAKTRELTDFTTQFAFSIQSHEFSYADGLAFFLTANYSPSGTPVYSEGGYLGLFCNSTIENRTINAVAVEFDTFSNAWDPRREHLGIDVNSINSSATVLWNGSVKVGRPANARVSYNASTYNLSLFLTYESTNLLPSSNYSLHYIVDLRKVLPEKVAVGFSAAIGNFTETHSIFSWSFSSSLQPKNKKPTAGLVAGLVVSGVFVSVLVLMVVWLFSSRKKMKNHSGKVTDAEDMDDDDTIDHEFETERGPKRFPYRELAAATRDFSEERKLGEGGSGLVYKGYLNQPKLDVAIKRISKGSKQGRKEYISEVRAISRLRHRNLVQLIGWCHNRGEFLLVYEFMPNGSLDAYIYSTKKHLEWSVRHKIVLGLASALCYLHEEWEQCVVHRDIKTNNIMLDSAFNAKLGDFGLARLMDHDSDLQTTDLAGTRGYMAPEYFYTGKASKESDVYGFGIVLLEIACGRRTIEPMEHPNKVRLAEWVWELYGRQAILEAADEKLKGDFDEKQIEMLMVVGLWCAHPDCNLRPSIKQAISALKSETPLPVLPASRPMLTYCVLSMDDASIASVYSVNDSPSDRRTHSFQ
ncbi:hypothetical protein B296_00037610 [Ensete ventricosum]|uniref:non-specific serine/threonine protein kinase n=1 Tax=Ensete ventricosum TaxID=4639 RepID=A0A426ZXT8_ENSVE|nr:hypothetical protein B296_00037610 [Ensete ventricosum]